MAEQPTEMPESRDIAVKRPIPVMDVNLSSEDWSALVFSPNQLTMPASICASISTVPLVPCQNRFWPVYGFFYDQKGNVLFRVWMQIVHIQITCAAALIVSQLALFHIVRGKIGQFWIEDLLRIPTHFFLSINSNENSSSSLKVIEITMLLEIIIITIVAMRSAGLKSFTLPAASLFRLVLWTQFSSAEPQWA